MRKSLFPAIAICIALGLCAPVGAVSCQPDPPSGAAACRAALDEIYAAGFAEARDDGYAYHPQRLTQYTADDIARIIDALRGEDSRAAIFFLNVAGATLENEDEVDRFIQGFMLTDNTETVRTLEIMSNLIKRRSQNTQVALAMLNISRRLDGEQALDFLKALQAIYLTEGGQGVGINLANFRADRTKAEHLPAEIMQALADRLPRQTPAHRRIIFQVEHMGHDRGMGN